MSRFSQCLPVILKHEGGKVDHKNDRGGRTAYGITQKVYSDFLKLRGSPDRDVWDIHDSEIEAIYSGYWKNCHCSYMPEPLDLLVFDAGVNHGPSRAIKMLQRVLGVDEDGICGKNTLAALHEDIVATSVESVCKRYLDERDAFFDRIIANDPSQSVFAKGWGNRVDHLRELV